MVELNFKAATAQELLGQIVAFAKAIPFALTTEQPAPVPAPETVAPAPAQTAAPAPVIPTAAPSYTHEQLSHAAALFADQAPGNREKVMGLLAQFGVQMMTAIPEERVGEFALALRQLGANI